MALMMQNLSLVLNWIEGNLPIFILSVFAFMQFVGFQALLIHYTLFRKSLKRPRPDGLRFQQIEKTLAFHAEQMDRIFEKMAELKKDLSAWAKAEPIPVKNTSSLPSVSVEANYLSLGELNLKKKLEAFRQS